MKVTISSGCTGPICWPCNASLIPGKTGIHEITYKDTKIKVEIKKKGSDVVVKRFRAV